MAKKAKPARYVVKPIPPEFSNTTFYRVIDTQTGKPVGRKFDSEYAAEDEAARCLIWTDQAKIHAANHLRTLLGDRNRRVFTVQYGFNRSTGGPRSIACLVLDPKKGIRNVSGFVSTLLGLKWYDNDSVGYNNAYALVDRLARMLYRTRVPIKQVSL